MQEYYFIWALAIIWTIFAIVQDLRKREVANWLNFSLIGIALTYRAFYAAYSENLSFFIDGIIGFGLFYLFALGLYYARAFAGGDAKLLMGYGAIMPLSGIKEIFLGGIIFLFLLFAGGFLWSILFSLKIVRERQKKFVKAFKETSLENYWIAIVLVFVSVLILIFEINFWIISTAILLSGILLVYFISIDKILIVSKKADELSEGDWLFKDVKLGKKTIKKTVHGLSFEDIALIKKYGKNVLIREGIPFTPAFLIAFGAMLFFFLILKQPISQVFSLQELFY